MTARTDDHGILEAATGQGPFDADTFRRRARVSLLASPPAGHDDPTATLILGSHVLNRGDVEVVTPRLAAVLVPVVARPEGATVLMTQRSAHLVDHAGQIAFPGGKLQPADTGPLDAALREAGEEIGMPREEVETLGYLDIYPTHTGFRIVPVVGLVRPDLPYRLDPNEVSAIFEVPLAFLMCPDNHQRGSREARGAIRHFYAMPFEERYIWGVTAGILRNLYDRVYC